MPEKIEVLKQILLFKDLSNDDLEDILSLAAIKKLSKGDIIFNTGDSANYFYVIIEGKVRLFQVSIDGKEVNLHLYSKGNSFGEVALFLNIPYPAFASRVRF